MPEISKILTIWSIHVHFRNCATAAILRLFGSRVLLSIQINGLKDLGPHSRNFPKNYPKFSLRSS